MSQGQQNSYNNIFVVLLLPNINTRDMGPRDHARVGSLCNGITFSKLFLPKFEKSNGKIRSIWQADMIAFEPSTTSLTAVI